MILESEKEFSLVLNNIAHEIHDVQIMLLQFEEGCNLWGKGTISASNVQKFDLSLQILKDLENLSLLLAQQLPRGMKVDTKLALSKLLLGRTRAKFGGEEKEKSDEKSTALVGNVDLF